VNRVRFKTALPAAALGLFCIQIHAQQPAREWPSRPVRLVVPFAAGGPMDFIGHNVGQKLAQALGQNFFIENRTGGGGAIGADAVAKAQPDGHTVLLSSNSHTTLPSLVKNLQYDAVRDFAPVTQLMRSVGFLLVVHPSVPVRSVKEFIALANASPGKLSYGSAGIGNTMHFAAESFSAAAGVKMTHVPYKGVAQATIDLLAGRIDLCFASARSGLAYVRDNRLRALAITAPARWNELPDLPTMDEAGVRGHTNFAWYGFWLPAKVSPDIVARLHAESVRALEDPVLRRKFSEEGFVPIVSAPQEFARTINADLESNRRLVQRIGLTPQ
jgi:tripartite-type tricarboxylate transporter receptor subunit TctC